MYRLLITRQGISGASLLRQKYVMLSTAFAMARLLSASGWAVEVLRESL